MLVLSRKPGEKIYIGTDIAITLIEVSGNRVKIGIDAPENKRILRGELAFWVDAPGQKQPARTEKRKEAGVIAEVPVLRECSAAGMVQA